MIPYTKPSITEVEHNLVMDATINGWGDKCYEYVIRFENEFAQYVGSSYAIATSSCTGALTLAVAALNLQRGDEFIVADSNWIASVAPLVQAGLVPKFVDIREDTWCIDETQIEKAITPRTRAILAVHLYGNLAEMDLIMNIAQKHNLVVIEDAAEAIGAQYKGTRAGNMGHVGVFSFHGTKTLTTGEGGALVTSNPQIYDKALTLSNHGRHKFEHKQFWPREIGFKFKMSNLQAALGCGQLSRVEELVARKKEILRYYKELLLDINNLKMNPDLPDREIGAWMPTLVFGQSLGITREDLLEAFKAHSIDARVFFWPLSSLPMFSMRPENSIAYDIARRAINLPSFHDITKSEQEKIASIIRGLIREKT